MTVKMNAGVLPVRRALELAASSGAQAELLCAVVREDIRFSLAVTTTDAAPTLSIRLIPPAGRASDMLLGERDQFGPDSWDYPARISRPADRFILRLTRAGLGVDVPVLSASAAVLLQFGWKATPGDTASAVVAESTFAAALEAIIGAQASDGTSTG